MRRLRDQFGYRLGLSVLCGMGLMAMADQGWIWWPVWTAVMFAITHILWPAKGGCNVE